MAEAAVEDRPPQKFYCHICNIQFQNASANFTCPHCSDGFIEELQDPPANNEEMADVDDWEDDEVVSSVMDDLITLPLHLVDERRPGRPRSDGNRTGRRTLTRLASSNLRQQVPFENLLQDFIVNLGVGVNWGTGGNMQLFLGNPGDYAWGREGLDAIVTQLLNQMDSTGPPPVSKDVIDALPIVEVTDEQVTAKLQCSVCWEDFMCKENVRQLPCLHIYHEPCIRPWLELHGTCPICRQNLTNGEQSNSDNNHDVSGASGASNTSFNVLRTLFQPPRNTSSENGATSSSTPDGSGATSTRSRSHSDSTM